MRLFRTVIALGAVTALSSGASIAQAQSQTFDGTTKGCFGSSCSVANTSSNGHGVSFTGLTGVNSFQWTAMSGVAQTVNLGTFNFNAFSCSGDLLCGPDDFKLRVAMSAPPTVPGSATYFADVDAAFGFGVGGASIDFDSVPQLFTFDGGSATFKVNDRSFLGTSGNYGLTGTLTYTATTTPEPSSLALLGTGLFGLVPMVRRRRQ